MAGVGDKKDLPSLPGTQWWAGADNILKTRAERLRREANAYDEVANGFEGRPQVVSDLRHAANLMREAADRLEDAIKRM